MSDLQHFIIFISKNVINRFFIKGVIQVKVFDKLNKKMSKCLSYMSFTLSGSLTRIFGFVNHADTPSSSFTNNVSAASK